MEQGGVFSSGIAEVYVNGRSLKPELEDDMIEMLALKKDSQRSNRVPDDTFCKTVSEVQNKQKKVKCDEAVDVGNPQTPNQGRGNGRPLINSPPNNPNSYQPSNGNQQPLQSNHGYSNNPNGNNMSPNQGHINPPNSVNNRPSTTAHTDYEQTTTYQPNYSLNQNTNTRRPTQRTYQPTPNYPSHSNAPNDPNPNIRQPGRRPNPSSQTNIPQNSQPIRPQNNHPNSGNSLDCNKCNIQPGTNFGNNVELGNSLNIGKGTTIGNNCKVKDNTNVGDGVMIGSDSVVSENANIGKKCVLDDNSKIGPNANIEPRSYRTVPQHLISQPDPNNNLRQLMRGQIAKVRSHCQQPNQQLLDFAALASAKTMYLISLHGIPCFTQNLQNVQNKANGNYDSRAYEKLSNEEHFVDNSQPSRIEPDVKGEMIILMPIEQVFGRGNRSPGDSFCQTFMDIASKQRQVKCDK